MTEDQLEQEALGWLVDVGYQQRYGPELAPDGSTPERDNYRQVLLISRLRQAVAALNPNVPQSARDDAIKQVLDLGTPVLLAVNRHFHRLLVNGVPVEYQQDGETRGDLVRLVDWAEPARNEWLAVNQLSITGPHHTRRPDIILFVNGLPLVLIELKNPADLNANGTYFGLSVFANARKRLMAKGGVAGPGSIGWLVTKHPNHFSEGQPAWIVKREATCINAAAASRGVRDRPKRWSSSTC
jgi:type I site-specific restriction-modification system R (restriction) subunit